MSHPYTIVGEQYANIVKDCLEFRLTTHEIAQNNKVDHRSVLRILLEKDINVMQRNKCVRLAKQITKLDKELTQAQLSLYI